MRRRVRITEPRDLYRWRVRHYSGRRGPLETFVTEPTKADGLLAGLAKLRVRVTRENIERTEVDKAELASEQIHPQMELFPKSNDVNAGPMKEAR